MVINSLSFYPEVYPTYYSLLKDSFARYRILGCLAFSLSTSYISWLPFWPPMFLMRNMFTTLWKPLYVISFFLSYCLQDSLFTFDFWNLIIMCLGMSLWESANLELIGLCLDNIHIFIKFRSFQSFCSNTLSVFFWDHHGVWWSTNLRHWRLLSLSLCFFSSILFFLFLIQKLVIPLSYHLAQRFFLKESLLKSVLNLSFQLFSIFLLQSFFLFFFFFNFF